MLLIRGIGQDHIVDLCVSALCLSLSKHISQHGSILFSPCCHMLFPDHPSFSFFRILLNSFFYICCFLIHLLFSSSLFPFLFHNCLSTSPPLPTYLPAGDSTSTSSPPPSLHAIPPSPVACCAPFNASGWRCVDRQEGGAQRERCRGGGGG